MGFHSRGRLWPRVGGFLAGFFLVGLEGLPPGAQILICTPGGKKFGRLRRGCLGLRLELSVTV